MLKEDFFRKFGIPVPESKKPQVEMSILNYYAGREPDFAQKMLSYAWLEKLAPRIFKKFWAHHHYFLFVPKGKA
jgi:hypothetical protein